MIGKDANVAAPDTGVRKRRLAIAGSVKGRILLAFLIMSVITGALGLFAIYDHRREGDLISKTFDTSLTSINSARAAAADFNAVEMVFARRVFSNNQAERDRLDAKIAAFEKNLDRDLSVALDHAQSERASMAAARARRTISAWAARRKEILTTKDPSETWGDLDRDASVAQAQIELLVNDSVEDGFSYRQATEAAAGNNLRIDLLATLAAILVSFLIALVLSWMILGPIDVASEAVRKIAGGELDSAVPNGGAHELAALLDAMDVMRKNIKLSLQSEVSQRRSAQTRLADALESSSEGIVVVDAQSNVVLANSQASAFLAPRFGRLRAGVPAAGLMSWLQNGLGREDAVSPGNCTAREVQAEDGRWFRISQNATQEGGEIIVFNDITVFKEQEAALQATNQRFDIALANMSQGLCLYDANRRLQVFNRRFHEIFRLPSAQIETGMALDQVIEVSLAAGNFSSRLDRQLLEMKTRFDDGAAVKSILELPGDRLVALAHQPMREGGWVETYEDVTDRLQSEAKVVYMARYDALTGLANRVFFTERVEQALNHPSRSDGFAVFSLNLDHFKNINESLGHPAGDAVLREVARRLSSCIGETDTLARLGGDEFAIMHTSSNGPDGATVLARRIVQTIKQPFDIEGQRVSIGVSIGISLAPGDGTSFGKLLKNAGVALYRAKTDGRDTWRFFEMEMDARLQARRALEIDLRDAMAQKSFDISYQPLFDFKRNRIGSFEALLRWNHPTRGMVSPAEFIPLAEESGLITRLGEWVLRRACMQARTFSDGVRVAVNVSPAQFKSGNLASVVVDALAKSGLAPNRLELEITESVILSNSEATLATLSQIRGLGVKIAMDDFGTGYSSLSYLRSFPFDKVKIDQSFTRDLDTKADSGVIIGAIIGLCANLGMRVAAEGVETQAQLDFLRLKGCGEAQGYYFSKPVPYAQVEGLIAKWTGRSEAGPDVDQDRRAG